MRRLEGRRALVTGGASGIGRAAALLFAQEGAAVAIADIDASKGQSVADHIRREGGTALFLPSDLTRAEVCRQAVERTLDFFGPIDVLLNSAGVISRRTVVELEEPEWDRIMGVNLKSVYLMCRYVIPVMKGSGGGCIINVASGWGLVGGPRAAAYCASKGAVVLLTKAMAVDHAPDRIRVNCLCPGDTATAMLREEARQLGVPEDDFLASAARRPLGRVGAPEEIAQAGLYLASDESSFVTGATLVVDGGGLAGS